VIDCASSFSVLPFRAEALPTEARSAIRFVLMCAYGMSEVSAGGLRSARALYFFAASPLMGRRLL